MKKKLLVIVFLLISSFAFSCERQVVSNTETITKIMGISIRNISSVDISNTGDLGIGTSDKGIFYQFKGKWIHFSELNGLSSNAVHCVAFDENNTLWIGTAVGINYIRNKEKKVISKFASGEFKDNIIQCMDAYNGKLYIGTTKGFCIFDIFGDIKESFTENDGLTSNIVNSVYCTSDGMLYIGTANGLCIYDSGTIQSVETFSGKWVTNISGVRYTNSSSKSSDKTLIEKLKLFCTILLSKVTKRKFNNPSVNQGQFDSVISSIKSILSKKNYYIVKRNPVYIGTSGGCYLINHEDISSGEIPELESVSSLWVTGLATDKYGNPCIGSKNGCINFYTNRNIFGVNDAGFSKIISQNKISPESAIRLNVNDSYDIIGIKLFKSGKKAIAIKGVGLCLSTELNVNYDAAFYGLIFKNSDEFYVSGKPTRVTQKLKNSLSEFIKKVKSRFPNNKVWIGHFSDLTLNDIRNLAILVGQYSYLVCIKNLSYLVNTDPVIIIPVK